MKQLKPLKEKKIYILIIFNLFFISLSAQDSIVNLNFLFVGDIMGHDPQIISAQQKDKTYNYKPCFEYVKPIIEASDFAIGNLEVTLPGEVPYEGYPLFKSPDALATALKDTGFDMLLTANNHCNDSRAEGLINTIKVLEEHDFYQTGTFKDTISRALYYPLIVYRNQFKLAFLNYTYDTNGIPTRKPTLVNEIDEDLIKKDMAAARAVDPDAIIVVMHWGEEYHLEESKKQQKLTQQFYNWGATMIIGAHPHVVQPIKEMNLQQADSTTKKVITAYSLGNFISGQTKPNTDGGLIFEISLEKDLKTGKTTIGEHHYIPVWRYIHRDKKGKEAFYSIPIAAFENDETNILEMTEADKTAMAAYAKMIRTHLGKYSSSERLVKWKTTSK